jgi:glycosyltransferase involved in cell wall biosynthesis
VNAADNPMVSVIVPARNEEACLARCLESLVSQTGVAFELIVVDDASTDRTGEIARSFADRPGVDARGYTTNVGAGVPARIEREGTASSRAVEGERAVDGTAVSRALPKADKPFRMAALQSLAVIPAPDLPENWTGKNNAMSAGAKIAKGKWLLFTDADTFHKPGSLARAVTEAEQRGAALLSYSPEQEVRGFWEKAVMPVIFAELAVTYPPKKVNDPASPIAAANGQYLMISREAYDAVGGYAAIANNLLEDVAMARLVKSSGRKVFFRYGGDAVRTHMYRSFAQMKEGWTKNLALLFPKPAKLARHRFGEFVLMPLALSSVIRGIGWFGNPILWNAERWLRWWAPVSGSLLFTVLVCGFIRRLRKANFPWLSIPRGYLGLPVFAYLLLRSERAYKRSRFDWKDRTYVYTPGEVKALSAARSASGGTKS